MIVICSVRSLLTLEMWTREVILGLLSDWSASPNGPLRPEAPLPSAEIPDYQSVTGCNLIIVKVKFSIYFQYMHSSFMHANGEMASSTVVSCSTAISGKDVFWLQFLVMSPQGQLEMSRRLVKSIHWFHAYNCSSIALKKRSLARQPA